MFLDIDQVRAHMVFDDFRHEPGHCTARARDQVHDLVTPRLAHERPFDTLHLAPNPAHARQELFLIANCMTHTEYNSIAPYPILFIYTDASRRHRVAASPPSSKT